MKSLAAISFTTILTVISILGITCSCNRNDFHIYSDPAYSARIESRFNERKTLAKNRDAELFGVFSQKLTVTEREGLKFLFSFMPLSDLADYSGEFYLNQVRWSIAARDTFAWGSTIPEDIFRHFVLPYRINNENLDTARIVFFRELKDRIRNRSMLEAAIEVNHWCHEKVTYRGSDIRTSSPLASVKTAYGRCGEESTFTVAALRSVAIPARQVYTPRWAHSDDNHAWVEFWADGKWHYMGACEPECIPDLGWFTEPARRAMLIHTKAFGDYLGDERVENRETNYALLNTLSTYAPTREIFVRVSDRAGAPLKNATVEFALYNYAEFYPISVKKTDDSGFCSFLTGFGDLLIWAHDDNRFGFKKITVADVDTLHLIADQDPINELSLEIDMIPPIIREPLQIVNNCNEQNIILLQKEDSIRGAYEKTFRTEEQARGFALSLSLDPDETWNFIQRSRGNYNEIEYFLKAADPELRPMAMELLGLISDKDLRDTRADILLDHLAGASQVVEGTRAPSPGDLLNPRVTTEMLVAYRAFLTGSFGPEFAREVRQNPNSLIEWIRKEIKTDPVENYYNTPLTPVGVYKLRVADEDSRKIFAVACFRTFGIPSRLKPGTLEVEYWQDNKWNTVNFGSGAPLTEKEGLLILVNDPSNPVKPQYETHYTLARYEKGKYKTLAYGYENGTDPLAAPLSLAPGHYLLVAGNRVVDGKVLAGLSFFELKAGDRKELKITLRKSEQAPQVLGKVDPSWAVEPIDGKPFDWAEIVASDRAVLCWVEPDREPSKHIFQDLISLRKEMDKTNCPFIFMVPPDRLPAGFTPDSWKIFLHLPGLSPYLICRHWPPWKEQPGKAFQVSSRLS
jgi:transglutaminase-like putative cysteine protease